PPLKQRTRRVQQHGHRVLRPVALEQRKEGRPTVGIRIRGVDEKRERTSSQRGRCQRRVRVSQAVACSSARRLILPRHALPCHPLTHSPTVHVWIVNPYRTLPGEGWR